MNNKPEISDTAANIVENLACRIAERNRGRISANHLIPYLPMSLGLIQVCLDNMVDGTTILAETIGNRTEYEFSAYSDTPVRSGAMLVQSCVSCDADIAKGRPSVLCRSCADSLRKELNRLADASAWPALAVYEHEILYIAANQESPLHAQTLAGHSRYTLRNMRGKLDRMTGDGFITQDLDPEKGLVIYSFPTIAYSKERYRENMALIRSYPASATEEMELKIVRIIMLLAMLLLCTLVLAFLHVPFPLLLAMFVVVAPIIALTIWFRRYNPEED